LTQIRVLTLTQSEWKELLAHQPPPAIKDLIRELKANNNAPYRPTEMIVTKKSIQERFAEYCKSAGLSYELVTTDEDGSRHWSQKTYSIVKISR
jgi:hypothetical protein